MLGADFLTVDDACDLIASALDTHSTTGCWGSLLQGNGIECTPGFVTGSAHFKNKLCPTCRRDGLLIPTDRVRAISVGSPALAAFRNKSEGGLWTAPPDGYLGASHFRTANHTAKCVGPRLVIFARAAPASLLEPVPAEWLVGGCLHLLVSKGTLVPSSRRDAAHQTAATLVDSVFDRAGMPQGRLLPSKRALGHGERASASSSNSRGAVSTSPAPIDEDAAAVDAPCSVSLPSSVGMSGADDESLGGSEPSQSLTARMSLAEAQEELYRCVAHPRACRGPAPDSAEPPARRVAASAASPRNLKMTTPSLRAASGWAARSARRSRPCSAPSRPPPRS
jgi:hypothetical protein